MDQPRARHLFERDLADLRRATRVIESYGRTPIQQSDSFRTIQHIEMLGGMCAAFLKSRVPENDGESGALEQLR